MHSPAGVESAGERVEGKARARRVDRAASKEGNRIVERGPKNNATYLKKQAFGNKGSNDGGVEADGREASGPAHSGRIEGAG